MKTSLAAIDPGGTLVDSTTGICRSGDLGFQVGMTYSDAMSRAGWLGRGPYDCIAIGAPVLPPGVLHYDERPCEKVFCWEPFRHLCLFPASHVGNRRCLRRAGCDTARQLSGTAASMEVYPRFPRVYPRANLVEAFPVGFMAVMLPKVVIEDCPSTELKSAALFEACVALGLWHRVREGIAWPDTEFWAALPSPDLYQLERAAMVCLLTAACVWAGKYVAVGEPEAGYLFLPPWELWQRWAQEALDRHRISPRLHRSVEVWIDGARYRASDLLPLHASRGVAFITRTAGPRGADCRPCSGKVIADRNGGEIHGVEITRGSGPESGDLSSLS